MKRAYKIKDKYLRLLNLVINNPNTKLLQKFKNFEKSYKDVIFKKINGLYFKDDDFDDDISKLKIDIKTLFDELENEKKIKNKKMVDYVKRDLNKLIKSYNEIYDFINSKYLNQMKISKDEINTLENSLDLMNEIFKSNNYKLKVDVNKFKLMKNEL